MERHRDLLLTIRISVSIPYIGKGKNKYLCSWSYHTTSLRKMQVQIAKTLKNTTSMICKSGIFGAFWTILSLYKHNDDGWKRAKIFNFRPVFLLSNAQSLGFSAFLRRFDWRSSENVRRSIHSNAQTLDLHVFCGAHHICPHLILFRSDAARWKTAAKKHRHPRAGHIKPLAGKGKT